MDKFRNDAASILRESQSACDQAFKERELIELTCQRRVLDSFQDARVSSADFAGSSGYGYDDRGREQLERVFAHSFECEDALVRPSIVSGTHAIALSLFGLLRPGETMLSVTGKPYDTLDSVIGHTAKVDGSLSSFGINYSQIELGANGLPDLAAIRAALTPSTRIVYIQRSRGYAWRLSLAAETIGEVSDMVHKVYPDVVVFVDNCYCEFAQAHEPTYYGADVMAGSLIKNPGGGLAPTGGYIVGRADLIERIAGRLTCPGIGREVGSYEAGYRLYFQGLFMAPHVVCQASKAMILTARVFTQLGFMVNPKWDEPRCDIVQTIRLGDPKLIVRFCESVQASSPVDSFARPVPDSMPGYADPVIMAAGTFIGGASLELSCDAPIRPPYDVYLQGGLTLSNVKLWLERAVKDMGIA